MQDTKYCMVCGKKISDINMCDWYSHMSIKYCPECRKKSDSQKSAERMRALRARLKQEKKAKFERLELLEIENELLRRRIIKLREEESAYASHPVDFNAS